MGQQRRQPFGASGHSLVSWPVWGVPIEVDSSWLFILGLVSWSLASHYFPGEMPGLPQTAYWIIAIAAAMLLFVCVLLHELGHAVVARAAGIPVLGITLFVFGGVAHISRDPRRPSVEFVMALAGPLVSLGLAASCWLAAHASNGSGPVAVVSTGILRYLAMVNLALLCFNLLPGFPLDGGRLLRATLWAWSGNLLQATYWASRLGSFLALALFALGAWAMLHGAVMSGIWYGVLGFFLRDAAQTTQRAVSWRLRA